MVQLKVINVVVFDKELRVCYDLDGDLIELMQSTNEETTFELSILDIDRVEGKTTINFNGVEELEEVIKHFKETFAKIQ